MDFFSHNDTVMIQVALDPIRREQWIRSYSRLRIAQVVAALASAFGCWLAIRHEQLLNPAPFIVFFLSVFSFQSTTTCIRIMRLAEALEKRTNANATGIA